MQIKTYRELHTDKQVVMFKMGLREAIELFFCLLKDGEFGYKVKGSEIINVRKIKTIDRD